MVDIRADQALVNVTWKGQNADLPDPISLDATDGDIRQWVTEAVQGGIPGAMDADPGANFTDFVVDRFAPTAERPYNLIQIRPKTPFGRPIVDDASIKLSLAMLKREEHGPWMIGMIRHCIDELLRLRRQLRA